MAARLEATRTPGIYKRGNRYVVVYRHTGKQHKRFCHTYAEARSVKAQIKADIDRGEHVRGPRHL